MRLLDLACQTPWAITEDMLRTILQIAARENTPAMVEAARAMREDRISRQAVMFQQGRPLDGTKERVSVRDGIAIVPIEGPIFRRADMFSEMSGATSVDTLARDFRAALSSPLVDAILLTVDSPGGEAAGINELAATIFSARGQKPITAYVDGLSASAGYWLASAADDIVVDDMALVGSIGVVIGVRDPSQGNGKEITFVSSQSPHKRPNPTTEQGKAQFQAMADDMAAVFVAAVARHRGISIDTVLSDFGQGGMFVGQAAVTAGLADRVGSFEGVLTAMQERARQPVLLGQRGAVSAATKEPRSMANFKDMFKAMFSAMEETEAGIPQAVEPAIGHPQGTQIQGHTEYAPGATMLLPVASADTGEIDRLRAELAKERSARVTSDAEHFADTQIAAQKALPAERPAIVQAYTQFVGSAADQGSAVAALSGLYAQRPPHNLTGELVPAGAEVLGNQTTTPKPEDEDAKQASANARAWATKQNGHAPKGA